MQTYPLTLLYDGACPLCSMEMERLMVRNRNGQLRFVDASAPGFDAKHYGTTQEEVMRIIHGVCADGSLVRGVEAIRLAYAAAGLHGLARLLDMPLARAVANRTYPYIADNRYLLSRRLRWLISALSGRRTCSREGCNMAEQPKA